MFILLCLLERKVSRVSHNEFSLRFSLDRRPNESRDKCTHDLNPKIELPTNIFFVYALLASCHTAKFLAFGRAKPLGRSVFRGNKFVAPPQPS